MRLPESDSLPHQGFASAFAAYYEGIDISGSWRMRNTRAAKSLLPADQIEWRGANKVELAKQVLGLG